MFKKSIFIALTLFLLFEGAKAQPVFSDPVPPSYPDTYGIYGRNTDVFSVKVENVDTSTVMLHYKTDDPYAVWGTVAMNCFPTSSFICNSTIPGLDVLAHDGNWLLYYFDANDTNGNYGNLGDSTNPLHVHIDRSPPIINFTSPLNDSFASGNLTITLEAYDPYTLVDINTVKYSFDNSSWLPLINTSNTTFSQCVKIFCWTFQIFTFNSTSKWDTRIYANNQTVKLYAMATDILGNTAYTDISTTIDNELPRVFIVKPQLNQTLCADQTVCGDSIFEIMAEDTYSGLNLYSINYNIKDKFGNFLCSGNNHSANCTATFNSLLVPDGYYPLLFNVFDMAKNERTNSTNITIDNDPPLISNISPDGIIVSRNVNISATVKDYGVGVANVSFRIEFGGNDLTGWKKMNCEGDYCSASWDSTQIADGTYGLRIYALDKIGHKTSLPVQFSISNQGTFQGGSATTTTLSATTTTSPTQHQPGSSVSEIILQFNNTLSNLLDKIKENLILVGGLVLIPFLLLLLFLPRRKVVKISSFWAKSITEKYLDDFDRIQSAVSSAVLIQDINLLKDRARLVLVYLRTFEENFMKRAIEETLRLIKDKDAVNRLRKCFDEKNEEIENIQEIKTEYLDEIFKSLNDVLKLDDIASARRSLENTMNLLRKYKNLIDREIAILSDCLNRANVK